MDLHLLLQHDSPPCLPIPDEVDFDPSSEEEDNIVGDQETAIPFAFEKDILSFDQGFTVDFIRRREDRSVRHNKTKQKKSRKKN